MGNKSKAKHWKNGSRINETEHGTCEHQYVDGKCVRCDQKQKNQNIIAKKAARRYERNRHNKKKEKTPGAS